jgi:5-deoxy-D-glucuronate isomerase
LLGIAPPWKLNNHENHSWIARRPTLRLAEIV